jgi:hypothetical protein
MHERPEILQRVSEPRVQVVDTGLQYSVRCDNSRRIAALKQLGGAGEPAIFTSLTRTGERRYVRSAITALITDTRERPPRPNANLSSVQDQARWRRVDREGALINYATSVKETATQTSLLDRDVAVLVIS